MIKRSKTFTSNQEESFDTVSCDSVDDKDDEQTLKRLERVG